MAESASNVCSAHDLMCSSDSGVLSGASVAQIGMVSALASWCGGACCWHNSVEVFVLAQIGMVSALVSFRDTIRVSFRCIFHFHVHVGQNSVSVAVLCTHQYGIGVCFVTLKHLFVTQFDIMDCFLARYGAVTVYSLVCLFHVLKMLDEFGVVIVLVAFPGSGLDEIGAVTMRVAFPGNV